MLLGKLAAWFILVFVLVSQAIAQVEISGTWQARYMLTDITVHVNNRDDTVDGFVIVHDAQNGTVYHFTGTFNGNTIHACHRDGYAFTGHLTSNARIVGTLTTNKNVSIQLTMTKTSQQDLSN